MAETRFGKLGRFEAQLICALVSRVINETRDKTYTKRFFQELGDYSNIPRRKGEPANEGCVFELEGLNNVDIYCPEEVARVVKERLHTKYQKQNSERERKAFIAELNRYFALVSV